MASRYDTCLPRILAHEGGYVNHPKDPGGATNRGVIQRTYDAYRKARGQATQSVANITDAEISAIYKQLYWDASKCDQLPIGVDYAVFDWAVNGGVYRAAQHLQQAVGLTGAAVDGNTGPRTIAAATQQNSVQVVARLCDVRLAYLQTRAHWATFKNGWTRRVNDVKRVATEEARGGAATIREDFTANPEAARVGNDPTNVRTILREAAKNPAAAVSAVGAVATPLVQSEPIQWALAALIVLGGAYAIYTLLKKRG